MPLAEAAIVFVSSSIRVSSAPGDGGAQDLERLGVDAERHARAPGAPRRRASSGPRATPSCRSASRRRTPPARAARSRAGRRRRRCGPARVVRAAKAGAARRGSRRSRRCRGRGSRGCRRGRRSRQISCWRAAAWAARALARERMLRSWRVPRCVNGGLNPRWLTKGNARPRKEIARMLTDFAALGAELAPGRQPAAGRAGDGGRHGGAGDRRALATTRGSATRWRSGSAAAAALGGEVVGDLRGAGRGR